MTDSAAFTAKSVNVSGSVSSGFVLGGASEASLLDCGSVQCGMHGVYARDEGSVLTVKRCSVQQNVGCGMLADLGALVEVSECCSSRNRMAGYQSQHSAKMTVAGSFSNSDKGGCVACDGGKLVREEVREDGVVKSGILT